MFIDPNARERVVHPDDLDKPEAEQRVITLRKQLNRDQRAKVFDAAMHVEIKAGSGGTNNSLAFGSFQAALLEQYIVGWSGPNLPKFDAELIVNLDDEDQHVKAAAEAAAKLWNKAKPDPKD